MFKLEFISLLIKLSWRSIWSHRIKSFVVGCIIAVSVYFLVLTDALMTSINLAMEESLTQSMTGHIQVYDADARDKFTMLGMVGSLGSDPNVGRIENFSKVKKVVMGHPNVDSVIPMGTDYGLLFDGNAIDMAITEIRKAETEETREHAKAKFFELVKKLHKQYEFSLDVVRDREAAELEMANLALVLSEAFWMDQDEDFESKLMFLETKIAPLVKDGGAKFIQFLATDIDRFVEAFPYFKMVSGERVPEGGRGILINHDQYKWGFRNRMARTLDWAEGEITRKDNGPISKNFEIQSSFKHRQQEVDEWMLDLEAENALKLREVLAKYFAKDLPLEDLLKLFWDLDDTNFFESHAFFWSDMAPFIKMYSNQVGEMLTLNKLGDGSSIKVKFYGTYTFDGLEDSGFAGFYSLMDMTSFREMHGFSTPEKLAEVERLKSEVGVEVYSQEEIDNGLVDALFGEDSDLEMSDEDFAALDGQEAFEDISNIKVINIEERMARMENERFTQEQIENGPSLSAAIILKDRSDIDKTRSELDQLFEEHDLPVQSIDWQEAAGFVGQMITVMQVVLYTFIVFVFCVAIVIINNAMLMATMQRYNEIGTLRAIGAGRSVIMGMFLCESILLAVIAGSIGLMLAGLTVDYLGNVGIPAPRYEVQFVFGGERLYPSIAMANIYLGVIAVFIVSVGATLFPALNATRISPVVAMNATD